jgi:glycosyltransferase 2 family protein
VPLAMLASALPVAVSGLGVFEGVLDVLYTQIGGAAVATGTGFVVGLAYRVMTIAIAIIGFGYYLANRAIVRQVMKQVSAEEALPDDGDGKAAEAEPTATQPLENGVAPAAASGTQ